VATPQSALAVHAAALSSVMTRICDGPGELAELLADPRKNAVVMGPGLGVGDETRAMAAAALKPQKSGDQPRAVVLDADALTSFAGNPVQLADLVRSFGGPVVVTPHDGEFARLFEDEKGTPRDRPEAAALKSSSKLERARAGASLLGAIMVLKGADTVVVSPDGRAAIACDAPPSLATAGSGDVLAGIIGGLLAQSMPAFEAACAAVWLHGAAAREFGPGLISEDLPEALPAVLRRFIDASAV
jgi:hydroxyethylthiazole kinase-like uncharacterized protein yjeF